MPDIDRIGPTLRPPRRVVMRQSWRHLTFLHWEVPAESLRGLIPGELEVDTFDGRAYVGLVPFTMKGVRPVGLPSVRGLSDFHETNVRTYVHHRGMNPGVWFFSLDAANLAAVAIARATFGLNYQYARMSLEVGGDEARTRLSYASARRRPSRPGAGCRVEVGVSGPVGRAGPGTLEHFLLERYLLYTVRGGRLLRGQVHHPSYPIRTIVIGHVEETLLAANGLIRPDGAPLAHYAEGVDVEIFRPSIAD